MNQLSCDLVLAWRCLRRAPIFTAFSIVTLALGIGATTAIYSVIYSAMLRPPAIPEVERVANLYHTDPRRGGSVPMICLSFPDYQDYRTIQTSFSHLAAWTRFRQSLVTADGPEIVMGEMVSGEYFSVVGVNAALGRVILPYDDRPGAPRVIVLSDSLWRRRFGADSQVIGRTVDLGGEGFEVIGVVPPWFRGVDMPSVFPTPAWIPLFSMKAANGGDAGDRESRWLYAKGRLKPGRTVEQALAEFRAIGQQLDAEYPIGMSSQYRAPYNTSRRWFLMPAADVRMHESVDPIARPLAATVLVTVGLVLLVACTNIANLTLARGSARRHELAIRLALGASRWRLAREQLLEAALVSVAGAAVAFLLARVLITRVLTATMHVGPGMAVQFMPEMNLQVATACVAATALALVVFGVVPALHATRFAVHDTLASDGQGALPRWRTRRNVIAFQVTVSAGLIAVAVLCAQQLLATARHDSGLDLDRLAIARVDFRLQKKDEAFGRNVLEQAAYAARLLPGVEGVALASGLPVGTGTPGAMIAATSELTDGMLKGVPVELLVSTRDIFRVLGVRVIAGQSFDSRETRSVESPIVLSRRLAESLFKGMPAVGREVFFQRSRWVGEAAHPVESALVVGVAEDTDTGSVGQHRRGGVIYIPFAQHYEPAMSIIVRAASDPMPLVEQLRRTVQRTDPELAITDAGTGLVIGGAQNLVLKVGAAAATMLGGLALLLAMVGLYGVLSDLVQRRTREMGIRMALGADPSRLLRMILGDGLSPVVKGLAIGSGLGILLRLAFRPLFLRMMPAFDPILFVIVPIPFVLAALAAAYFPARRASRVDPNVALRHL